MKDEVAAKLETKIYDPEGSILTFALECSSVLREISLKYHNLPRGVNSVIRVLSTQVV